MREEMMKDAWTALLVHSAEVPLEALRKVLERLSARVIRAHTCEEASRILQSRVTPQLVFTDTVLPDGNWERVLDLAGKASEFVNVVVVSAAVDISLYVEVMERGAWDFMAPPFAEAEVAHVVRCGVENAHERRKTLARLYEHFDNAGPHEIRAIWTGWGN
jgi:DNA-binding NtrC family response regulator